MNGTATFYLLDESHNDASLRMVEKTCQLSAFLASKV